MATKVLKTDGFTKRKIPAMYVLLGFLTHYDSCIYLMIVASRSGPTEMILIGTSRYCSMNAM